MIEQVLEAVPKHTDTKEIYLHVWPANDDALRLYKRLGFEVAEEIANYYRGIEPTSCYVLRKAVN